MWAKERNETGSSCRFTDPNGGFGLWEKSCGATRLSLWALTAVDSFTLLCFTSFSSHPCVPTCHPPSRLLYLSCVQLLAFCHTSVSNWNFKSAFLYLSWPLSHFYYAPFFLLLHNFSLSLHLCSFVSPLSNTIFLNFILSFPFPLFLISCFSQVSLVSDAPLFSLLYSLFTHLYTGNKIMHCWIKLPSYLSFIIPLLIFLSHI